MSKFKSRVEKRRQSQSVVADNNGVVNSQVLIGLGKFKKSVLKKRVSVDEKPPEPTDQKMRSELNILLMSLDSKECSHFVFQC